MRWGFLFALFFFTVACDELSLFDQLAQDQEMDLVTLRADLESVSEGLTACRLDGECSALGIDPRPCGGTQNFLIVSKNSNNEGEYSNAAPTSEYSTLAGRVEAYNRRVQNSWQEQGDGGIAGGICDWVAPPQVHCEPVSETCQGL